MMQEKQGAEEEDGEIEGEFNFEITIYKKHG